MLVDYGFRLGRQCLSSIDTIDKILNNSSTCVFCLDFVKVYDKMDNMVLIHKLKKLQITGNLDERWKMKAVCQNKKQCK